MGSIRQLSNDTQSITQTTTYDAFGNIESSAGSSNAYKYAGQWGYRNDGDDGLMHVGARYYDALVGRFISADTYLGEVGNPQSLNRYVYVENNPVNAVDPTGHFGVFLSSSAIYARPTPFLTPRNIRIMRSVQRSQFKEFTRPRVRPPRSGDTLTPKDLAEMAKSPYQKFIDWMKRVIGVGQEEASPPKWTDPGSFSPFKPPELYA